MENQPQTPTMTNEQRQIALVKACYEEREMTINGRKYRFTNATHKQRRLVFTYFSKIQPDLSIKNLWFMESSDFAKVESTINEIITYDGSLISKIDDHWEKYPEDYVMFITVAMGVISYPFMKGISTN